MDDYEHHSITREGMDGGSVVTETHHMNGTHSQTKRFVPGKAPSRDLAALVRQGPSDAGTDGAGSNGFKGAKRFLDGHI